MCAVNGYAMSSSPMVDRIGITEDLRRLGLGAGDALVVHSSLRSIGPVEGGPEAAVAALLDVVGESGMLVAPTFTYWSERFDPLAEPGLTGQIAETVRARPGAVRSWHPTHSVAAIGTGAAALCAGHHYVGGLSRDSPLDRLARRGYVLLIGVGHVANSTVHVGEAHAAVPYLGVPFRSESRSRATVVVDEEEISVALREPPGCSRAFGAVEAPLRARGVIRDGMVGKALTQLVRGHDVIEAAIGLVQRDATALLCTDPTCYRCTEARRRARDTKV